MTTTSTVGSTAAPTHAPPVHSRTARHGLLDKRRRLPVGEALPQVDGARLDGQRRELRSAGWSVARQRRGPRVSSVAPACGGVTRHWESAVCVGPAEDHWREQTGTCALRRPRRIGQNSCRHAERRQLAERILAQRSISSRDNDILRWSRALRLVPSLRTPRRAPVSGARRRRRPTSIGSPRRAAVRALQKFSKLVTSTKHSPPPTPSARRSAPGAWRSAVWPPCF
jgi:hypothetical protein